jgi:alpha,alpha-trehalase
MGKVVIQMKHLFDQLHGLEDLRLGAILLFDYDGTLTPIVERPELAVLHPGMRKLLRSLVKHYKVAIISGRSLADIKKMVGPAGIYYAGNHGFEISGPKTRLALPQAKCARPTIHKICRELKSMSRGIEGVIIEDKGVTASVHYRLVARSKIKILKETFNEVVKPYVRSGGVRVTVGKKVFEIRPNVEWDKGRAVLWIINVADPKKKLIPLYFGDDQTDEDAFLALKDKGVTVLVSKKQKKSHAKFFLRDVGEVKMFLEKLVGV